MDREVQDIVAWMNAHADTRSVEGMARFGIDSSSALGLPMPLLRAKAKEYRKRHDIALGLWDIAIHEARLLAPLVDDPAMVTEAQMDSWTADFDSWNICDQCCINLFRHTPFAHSKIREYAADDREFVRRTAFVLIATLAVHDTVSPDLIFSDYLTLIERHASDGRNFVRKAVNWALRQIGKRNMELNAQAIEVSSRLSGSTDAVSRWVGKDSLRELASPKTREYILNHRKKFER